MSKVLEAEESAAYKRWKLPFVNGKKVSSPNTTAKELESIQKQAYDEAYADGLKKGYNDKVNELDNQINSLRSIIEILSEPLKEMDDEVVIQLSQLSMMVAKQVVRRELHTDEGEIVGVVREAMNALPASTRKITLNVHPDDSELIRNAFSLSDDDDSEELRWRLIEDPMVTRGGCKISSENSRIDATVEARMNRVINTLLGGERGSDD